MLWGNSRKVYLPDFSSDPSCQCNPLYPALRHNDRYPAKGSFFDSADFHHKNKIRQIHHLENSLANGNYGGVFCKCVERP